jgi:glucosamine-6-phosphate deaminase
MVHQGLNDRRASANGITVRVTADYAALSREAADIVHDTVRNHPGSAITLPTGETPRGMYEELLRRMDAGELDFSDIHLFCLDDYLGAGIDDPASLTGWLDEVFLTPANLRTSPNVHYVPTQAADPDAAADAYEAEIQAHGGLRLAVLGLGPNGHIGFNEPGSSPASRTRVVGLTRESREQNAQYYEGQPDIPTQAMTIGLATLLEADRIVMIVSGASKAGILRQVIDGPVTPDVPASYLQTVAGRVTILADEAAAGRA